MKTHCLSPQEIEAKLKEAGVQATAQRIAVCRYVLCEADHPSAEQVKRWLDGNFPKISLATVYNTLNILVSAGLLRILKLPDSDSIYYDANIERHYHFVDEETGQVSDVPLDAVEIRPRLGRKFRVDEIEVVLRGRMR